MLVRLVVRLLIPVTLVLALAACGGSGSSDSPSTTAELVELARVEQLRADFNERKGAPRLILILSPT